MKKELKLENWSVVETSKDIYKPKEQYDYRLTGRVYNHEKFHDGESIFTSRLIGKIGEKIKTSSGSIFELGEPSKKNKTKTSNAKEQLLKLIRKIK